MRWFHGSRTVSWTSNRGCRSSHLFAILHSDRGTGNLYRRSLVKHISDYFLFMLPLLSYHLPFCYILMVPSFVFVLLLYESSLCVFASLSLSVLVPCFQIYALSHFIPPCGLNLIHFFLFTSSLYLLFYLFLGKTISRDKTFTLGNLLEMNIFKHKEKIQEIATTASNEATLEQMLQKVGGMFSYIFVGCCCVLCCWRKL